LALRPDSKPSSTAEQRALAQQDVFMREVDDALREDQLKDAVTRYGRLAAVALGALLLALGGWLWWREHQADQAGKVGEKFTLGLDQIEAGRLTAGYAELEPLAKDGPAGARAAAKLLQAGILLERGDKAQAGKLFAEVSADDATPKPYRDLATLREVATKFDSLPPDTVIARLKPLATPGNAWFGSAGELVGMAYLKQGRNDLAGPLFGQIAKDKTVPESLRGRARQLAGLLGVDAIENVDQALADSPVAAAPAAPAAAPAQPQ